MKIKKLIIAVLASLFAVLCFWLSGNEFERGWQLGFLCWYILPAIWLLVTIMPEDFLKKGNKNV